MPPQGSAEARRNGRGRGDLATRLQPATGGPCLARLLSAPRAPRGHLAQRRLPPRAVCHRGTPGETDRRARRERLHDPVEPAQAVVAVGHPRATVPPLARRRRDRLGSGHAQRQQPFQGLALAAVRGGPPQAGSSGADALGLQAPAAAAERPPPGSAALRQPALARLPPGGRGTEGPAVATKPPPRTPRAPIPELWLQLGCQRLSGSWAPPWRARARPGGSGQHARQHAPALRPDGV